MVIPPHKGIRQKIKGVFGRAVEFFVKGRLLVLVVLAYIALGALLFHYLEKQEEVNAAVLVTEHHYNILRAFNETKRIIVAKFANRTPVPNLKMAIALMRRITKKHYIYAIKQARKATLKRFNDSFPIYQAPYHGKEGADLNKWGLISAAVFCATTLSTIGYGHVVPTTLIGRIVFLVYSIFAIPVMSIYLIDAVGLQVNVPFYFFIFVYILYMALGMYVFHKTEDWTWIDALYFVFVTLSTIGYGDFVPRLDDNVDDGGLAYARIAVSIFLILYVTAGLAITAMAVKMMTKDLSRRMRKVFPLKRRKVA